MPHTGFVDAFCTLRLEVCYWIKLFDPNMEPGSSGAFVPQRGSSTRWWRQAKPSPSFLALQGKSRKRLGFGVCWVVDVVFFSWEGSRLGCQGWACSATAWPGGTTWDHVRRKSEAQTSEDSRLQTLLRVDMGKLSIPIIRKDLLEGLKFKAMYCCKVPSLIFPVTCRIHFWALRFMRYWTV